MSNAEFVMVPNELAERAIDAFASIGMHDELLQLHEILDKPAEQHQGEPVARVEVGADRNACVTITDNNWLRGLKDKTIHQVVPLYTHADPGEVERLRYKAELYDEVWGLATGLGFMNVTTAISTLRAQLAERDALLREVAPAVSTWVNGKKSELRARIDAVLSASAEPKPFRVPDCPDCACVQDGQCLCTPSKPSAERAG